MLPQVVMATAMMIAAVEVEATVEDVTTTVVTAAEMNVIVDTAETVTTAMLPVELIVMPVMTAIAAEEVMTDVVAAEATLTAMSVVNVALPAMLRQLPLMVIQHLVERPGNHTEVEATMMRNSLVVNIES